MAKPTGGRDSERFSATESDIAGQERQALVEALRDLAANLEVRQRQVESIATELEGTAWGTLRSHSEPYEARQAEAHLAAIVRSSDDAMFSLTRELAVDSWNPAAERLLGYAPGEVVGRRIDSLIPSPEARRQFDDSVAQLRTGDQARPYDAERRRKDGSLVEVTVTLSAIRDEGGTLVGYSAVLHDLTERRKAEEQLAEAKAERNLLADRERIARDLHDLVIQQLFASGMSLQAALGLRPDPEIARTMEKVVQELDTTIRDIRSTIFELSRAPGAGASLRAQVLEVTANAAEALGFAPRARFEGPIDVAVPEAVAEHVLAVAREALSNVARHAHASTVALEVSAGDELLVVVEDNGLGLGVSTRRSGLDNLRQRAETLGGELRIDSETGGGTRLEWRVPLRGVAGHR